MFNNLDTVSKLNNSQNWGNKRNNIDNKKREGVRTQERKFKVLE